MDCHHRLVDNSRDTPTKDSVAEIGSETLHKQGHIGK